jgi:hypothetical protein
MKESYRGICEEEKVFCSPQTVEIKVAQNPAKKAGRLLPSHQRDETEMGRLPPACLSVNRLVTEQEVLCHGHSSQRNARR